MSQIAISGPFIIYIDGNGICRILKGEQLMDMEPVSVTHTTDDVDAMIEAMVLEEPPQAKPKTHGPEKRRKWPVRR